MKIKKSERREQIRHKKRLGMRMHGKDINLLLRIQEKRDKERMAKRDRKGTDQGSR